MRIFKRALSFGGGFLVGLLIGATFVGASMVSNSPISLSECRAANPGHDCDLGWVKGAAW